MKYCKKCVYPFVGVNLHFSDDGICSSCKTADKFNNLSKEFWEEGLNEINETLKDTISLAKKLGKI